MNADLPARRQPIATAFFVARAFADLARACTCVARALVQGMTEWSASRSASSRGSPMIAAPIRLAMYASGARHVARGGSPWSIATESASRDGSAPASKPCVMRSQRASHDDTSSAALASRPSRTAEPLAVGGEGPATRSTGTSSRGIPRRPGRNLPRSNGEPSHRDVRLGLTDDIEPEAAIEALGPVDTEDA